jgi:hypothetical protein
MSPTTKGAIMSKYRVGEIIKHRLDKNTCVVGTVVGKREISRVGRKLTMEVTLLGPNNLSEHKIRTQEILTEPKPQHERRMVVRPYTRRQVEKLCADMREDLVSEHSEHFDDACIDTAEGVLLTEPRVKAYFEQSGIPRQFWKEALADYIHG